MEKILGISVLLIGVFTFLFCFFRKNYDMLLNYLLRTIMGCVAIYALNSILYATGINIGVGLNGLTILAVGVLGIPGYIMLYLISIYFMFI